MGTQKALKKTKVFDEVILRDMPDPYEAHESIWIPFLKNELGADENTVIVGHSSGAMASIRHLEEIPLRGIVHVSACHTDLCDAGERAAGWHARPYQWD